MADTGAPYFIPYVEPTDLVRDYPAADEASADAIAAALDAIPVLAGIGSNVVYAQTTATATNTSTTFQNTPLAVTITPSSATSKILVFATWMGSNLGGFTENASRYILARETTQLREVAQSPQDDRLAHMSVIDLDSPSTTSPVTYRIRFRTQFSNGTVTFNRSQNRTESTGASTIVAIEVAE